MTNRRGRPVPSLSRLEPPGRVPGIDLARGAAVVGMFAAHLVDTPSLVWSALHTWAGLVDGRSSILFATLAGVSLTLSMPSTTRRGSSAPMRGVVARAVGIWGIGLFLVMLPVPVWVILPAYGLLLCIGGLLRGLSTRALFLLAATIAVVMPFGLAAVNGSGRASLQESGSLLALAVGWYYPFPLWSAFLLAGLAAGRVVRSVHGAATLALAGAGVAAAGYGLVGPIGDAVTGGDPHPVGAVGSVRWAQSVLQAAPHSSGVGEALGSGGFALAVIGVCVLAGATSLRLVVWPVRALGSMPLTAYAGHLLVWAVWVALHPGLDPLRGFRDLSPFWPMTIGITAFCSAWALLVGRGPAESALAAWTRAFSLPEAPAPPNGPGV